MQTVTIGDNAVKVRVYDSETLNLLWLNQYAAAPRIGEHIICEGEAFRVVNVGHFSTSVLVFVVKDNKLRLPVKKG